MTSQLTSQPTSPLPPSPYHPAPHTLRPELSGDPAPRVRSRGPHTHMAVTVALLALALSAITLARALTGSDSPRVPDSVETHAAAIQKTLDDADKSPPPPATEPFTTVTSRRPVHVAN